jgi:hypothetical protein
MRFVLISENNLNRYGYRVLLKGLLLKHFKGNPVMLYMHDRRILPIGRWKNLKIENGNLTAEPEFDMDDEFAAKIAGKVDRDFIRAVSVGILIHKWTEDAQYHIEGKEHMTIIKSELLEASFVDIPADRNAVRLYMVDPESGERVELNVQSAKDLYQFSKVKPSNMDEQLIQALGLSAGASVADAVAKINSLKADPYEAVKLSLGLPANAPANEVQQKVAELSLELGKSVKLNADLQAKNQALQDAQLSAADVVEAARQQTAQFHEDKKDQKEGGERANWSYADWMKNDPKGFADLAAKDEVKALEIAGR